MDSRLLLFRLLKEKGLPYLMKGFSKSPIAARRAVVRIKKGENPYRVLTEENKISVKPRDINVRAQKQGYGSPEDEVYHGSWTEDIRSFWPGSHFGTKRAAHDILKAEDPLINNAVIYPVRLSGKRRADLTHDLGYGIDLGDYIKHRADPTIRKNTLDTLKYINRHEDEGALSFINTKTNVRGRHAMYNPHWKNFKDLMAGIGGLSLLPLTDEEP